MPRSCLTRRTACNSPAAWAQQPVAKGKWWHPWLAPPLPWASMAYSSKRIPVPDASPSDGPNMVPLDEVERLLRQVLAVREAVTEES